MRSETLLGVSLSLSAILTQAACGSNSAAVVESGGSGKSSGAPKSRFTSTVILPEGTVLAVQTGSALSTDSNEAGQTFSASLDQPVLQDGREVAAKGARVEGRIIDADKGGKVKGIASMTVQLTGLDVGGQFVYISTSAVTLTPRSIKRKDAAEIASGTGTGGAATTGVVVATRGEPAEIPRESVLTFALTAAITVTVASW